jgi:hypothetical protein
MSQQYDDAIGSALLIGFFAGVIVGALIVGMWLGGC